LKVHFAGQDPFLSVDCLKAAGVKYLLQTYFVLRKNGHKIPYDKIENFNHVIVDSGLFTIMFGAESKSVFGEKESNMWFGNYVEWIKGTKFKNASFVECDTQKKMGVDYTWELRKEMKGRLPDKRIINVYHLEDENPDKLIAFSDYIAVSIPELRFNVSAKEKNNITRYISSKAHAKGKRVHLLGCTEKKMMSDFSYCYSCDSTSWLSGDRYGTFKNEIVPSTRIEQISQLGEELFLQKGKRQRFASAAIRLIEYNKYAGDQQ
jgi:hypothetical protein